jgi:hypothetical protein
MKIFISWSGNTSRAVAVALRQWLPSVLQIVQPYVSSEDIEKGARWSAEIARELNDTAFGVICVTKDNVGSPWLNFEAGALSKSVDTSRVSPFLLDLRTADLVGPLSQFQATLPQLEDVTRLVRSINSSTERPVDETRLGRSVEMWWPELEEQLKAIRSEEGPAEAEPHRESTDMIEELLEITRGIQRRLLRIETAEAPRENATPSRATRETLALESLILAKLEAALARTHEITSDTNLTSDSRMMQVDAIFSPLEAEGESYLIDLKYVREGSKNLLNRIIEGAGRLSMARKAYMGLASGPIHCIVVFIVLDHDENLMRRLKSQVDAIPDDMGVLAIYESEVRHITPSDLRQQLIAAASQSNTS